MPKNHKTIQPKGSHAYRNLDFANLSSLSTMSSTLAILFSSGCIEHRLIGHLYQIL